MQIKPYLIVPKMIPQPTWGGTYIATFKNRTEEQLQTPIGQSYELSSDTMLTSVLDSKDLPIEIGDPSTGKTIEWIGDQTTTFSLQSLIEQNPNDVLGEKYTNDRGPRMDILIKFTQAKGNSFQVHVKTGMEFGHWKAKPESWYFMEDGRATLGVKPGVDLEAYKQTCKEIEAKVSEISGQVARKEKTAEEARKEIQDFLMTHSPFLCVNVVAVPKSAVVDLSQGGIHHSWEEGDDLPNGNIIYEVQLNIMDNECTLRSFDKGKIGDDGKIRPVHIDDYFKALDTDPIKNDPTKLVQAVANSVLFDTPYYKTKQSTGLQKIESSFQHVFVKEGVLEIAGLTVRKGASVFIPKSYAFEASSDASVLVTYY